MYSPTTRLLTVLEMLQSYRQISGPDLARRLEVDVRTVRRYIVNLQDLGIPIEAERGPLGAYQLQRGHRLPPLMYTDAEAVALTLGLLAIRELGFPVEVAAVEGALAKTERVLPEQALQHARALQEAIRFNVSRPALGSSNGCVLALSLAVQQRRRVYLRYRSWQAAETERDFDPYGVVYNEGYWYTAGFCHLRQAVRIFRLDRVLALEPRAATFERPEPFDVLQHVLNSITFIEGAQQVEVVLKTTLAEAQAVITPVMGSLEATDEGVVLRRTATQLDWVAHVLMSLDCVVVVKQPAELRDKLRQLGEKALAMAAG